MIIEVLTEGASDVPVIREILIRHFELTEHEDFHIRPHRGRGNIPNDIHAPANPKRRGLLDQLPAKLRGYGRFMNEDFLVLVLIDADNDNPTELHERLNEMLANITIRPPRVLFRIAVEETESWFLADRNALKKGIPKTNLALLQNIEADQIVGAWEKIAESIGKDKKAVTGSDKHYWAEKIAPFLDFNAPYSPSLSNLISGIDAEIKLQ